MPALSKKVLLQERSISLLVPVLNEAENLEPTVNRLIDALTITIEDFEIIIVNDGSTDGTADVAERLAATKPNVTAIHNQRNMGLGYSYARGVEQARKEFFVYIPGDNTWPYRSFVELFGNLGRADIITSYAVNPEVRPLGRRIISKLYTRVLNLLFGKRMAYFNGLTIYPVAFLRRNPATTFGFGFQAEVLLKSLASGFSYIEVGLPIDERTAGGSKALNLGNIASVSATIFRLLWEIRVLGRWRPVLERRTGVQMGGSAVAVEELGLDPDIGSEKAAAEDSAAIQKTIVIAGASSGIGAALALDLAGAGHQIYACSRSMERLSKALNHSRIKLFVCDVSDELAVISFAAFVREQAKHVDVLINCAGGFGAIGSIDQVDSKEWMHTIQSNLFGTFLTIRHFLPLIELSDRPQILNFSGGGALSPFPNFSAYACAKAAIVRLTETLAVELASRGISCNAIAPGVIPTKAHEATIKAGEKLAGALQFRRTQHLLRNGADESNSRRMETIQQCVRALMSEPFHGLTGKTISANFDHWSSEVFRDHIADITRSELFTMRRVNVVNLPDGFLRSSLMSTWTKHGTRR